jgi:hypothetical protein
VGPPSYEDPAAVAPLAHLAPALGPRRRSDDGRQSDRHKMDGMRMPTGTLVTALALTAITPRLAGAQAPIPAPAVDADHAIVYEIGWAGDYAHAEGFQAKGATFAFEVTPIKDRLELEAGLTAIRANGVTETSVDLLFKKPWSFSKTVEFMAGVGPELIHATGADAGTFWGLSAVADFMFWPRKNVGWYLEPGYEADFRLGATRQGLAIAGGLILGR